MEDILLLLKPIVFQIEDMYNSYRYQTEKLKYMEVRTCIFRCNYTFCFRFEMPFVVSTPHIESIKQKYFEKYWLTREVIKSLYLQCEP